MRRATVLLCWMVLLLGRIALGQVVAAPTPPMGWNSWNHFAGKVTDKDIRDTADQMVALGMRDAGYVYVNIDDTWQGQRNAAGELQPNERFPDMKALADYVHSKGLKLGIYSGPGRKTCAGYEGSYGHEEQDAKQYAAWGIDYLKYDLCSFNEMREKAAPGDLQRQNEMMRAAYLKMAKALAATGRPIVYSLCQYGFDHVWTWGPEVQGSLWRTTTDIQDNYRSMAENGFTQAGLAKYAGPGRWNDPDMLEVGNGGMSTVEYQTHMSLWALLAAPLLAGNDLTKMSADDRAILVNREVIAIDQDRMGREGDRLRAVGPHEWWTKPLQDGSVAVGLFNRGEDTESMAMPTAAELGLKRIAGVRNVWAPSDAGQGPWMVPRHGVVLLVVRGESRAAGRAGGR